MSIWKFLGLDKASDKNRDAAQQTSVVRDIVESLDQMPEDQAKLVASFAYLLSRVAHADLDISKEETREMEQIVREQGGLPEDQALLVVQMAKTHARLFGGTENFLVARTFRDLASLAQKQALVRCLFAVAAADQSISTVEDNEIVQIATELNLDRREVASIRAEFKDHLAVLKP